MTTRQIDDPFGFSGFEEPPQRTNRPRRMRKSKMTRDEFAAPPPGQYYQNDPFAPTTQIIGAGLGAVVGLAALGAVSNVLSDGFGGGEDQYFKNKTDKSDYRKYKSDNDYDYGYSNTAPEDVYLNDYGEVGPQARQNLDSVVEQYGRNGLHTQPGDRNFGDITDILENNISASIYFDPGNRQPDQIASVYDDGSVAYYNTDYGYFSGGNTEYESVLAQGVEEFKKEGYLSEGIQVGPSEQYIGLRQKYNPRFQMDQYGKFEDSDLPYRRIYDDLEDIGRVPLQDQYFQEGNYDDSRTERLYSSHNYLNGNSVPEDEYLQRSGRPLGTAMKVLDSYRNNRNSEPYDDFGDLFSVIATYEEGNGFAIGESKPYGEYDYTPVIFSDGSAIYVQDTPYGFRPDEGSVYLEKDLEKQVMNEKFEIYSSTGEFFENGYLRDYGMQLGPKLDGDNGGGGYGDNDMPMPPNNPFNGSVVDPSMSPRIYDDNMHEGYPKDDTIADVVFGDTLGQDHDNDGVPYALESRDQMDDNYSTGSRKYYDDDNIVNNVRRNIRSRERDSDNDLVMSEIARNRLSRRMERSDNTERMSERARILDDAKSLMNGRSTRRNSKDRFDGYVINDYEAMDTSSSRSDYEQPFYRNGVAARAMGRV